MGKSKLVRNRVVINQASLDLLAELNSQAEKLDCVVVIGVLPTGTPMLGGATAVATPFYMVLEQDMFTEKFSEMGESHFAFTKEEALTKIINLGSKR